MHVATDVAARGLGISNVDLIIHYELPNGSDAFVHCFGGIGSVGKEGTVVLHSEMQRRVDRGTCILFGDAAGVELVQAYDSVQDGLAVFDLHYTSGGSFLLTAIVK